MNYKKYILLAALPITFAACQDDVLVENHESGQGITTLFGIMDDGISDSRAQIELGGTSNTKEKFMWNVGDQFTLYQTWQVGTESLIYSKHPFTISDDYTYDVYGNKGKFSTDEPLVAGRSYVAFYPTESLVGEELNPEGYVSFGICDSIPDNSEESWINYFRKNMYMRSAGVTDESVRALSFEHLCGIIRITYTNATDEDQELKGLYIDGSLGVFRQYNLFEPTDNTGDGNSARPGIEFTDKATVKAGESEDFYILFFPPTEYADVTINPMTSIFVDYDVEGTSNALSSTPDQYQGKTFSYEGFEAGKCYWFKVTGIENERLAWTKDYSTGEDDEVETPTVETHTATVTDFIGLRDALAVNAQRTVINFGADIKLDTPLSINCPTTFNMNGKTISLHESNYKTNGMNAVFCVSTRFEIKEGILEGKDGEKLHDYYFNLVGTQSNLTFNGTTLETGSAVINGVFMDDDGISLNDIWLDEENTKSSSITTSGDAIHYVAKQANPQMWSRINGTINGNVYVETQYETLNAKIIFQSGTINGNLNTNYIGAAAVADGVLKAQIVSVSPTCTGWDAAGLYVEDQRYYVTTFDGLKTALEAKQQKDEQTDIYLDGDIVMTEPVTINKPVNLHLSEKTLSLSSSFDWENADAAITNTTGTLTIYGRYNATGIENINGVISGSTTETGKYLIKSSSNKLRLEAVTINANGPLNAILVENNDLYTQGKYATRISADSDCYAVNMIAETSSANIWLQKETHIVGNVGFTLNIDQPTGIADTSNDKLSTIDGDLIVTGTYANSLRVDVNRENVNGDNWPTDNGGGDEGYGDIDPNAKPVGTFEELQNALTWDGPIYLTANIELTSPLLVEEIGKPIFLNGKTISMSSNFEWGNADAVITSKGAGLVIFGGTLKGPETDQTIAKSFFKVVDNGSLQLDNGADIRANAIQDAIYVKDASCFVLTKTKVSAERYAINMDADKCCDVDIYTGIVDGDIRFALNAQIYGDKPTYCRFGVGLSSQVTGDLIMDGTYKDTATGYHLEKEATAYITGSGWDKATMVYANQ